MIKVIGFMCLLMSSVVGASLTEEPVEREDTKLVLLQATSVLGETQVGLVVTFIETTLGVNLNENAAKADSKAYKYKSNKWITPVQQQLIADTLPINYEVRVTFPIDTADYKPRPGEGGGNGSLKGAGKTKRK